MYKIQVGQILSYFRTLRGEMKKSRYKIWLRAFLLMQFSAIFGYYLFLDIKAGNFNWGSVALLITLCLPVGFLMSRLVPMRVNVEAHAVTLAVDKFYLLLIWILVIAKLVTGYIPHFHVIADVIMCAILGIMAGRLGGIGLCVRQLKIRNGL